MSNHVPERTSTGANRAEGRLAHLLTGAEGTLGGGQAEDGNQAVPHDGEGQGFVLVHGGNDWGGQVPGLPQLGRHLATKEVCVFRQIQQDPPHLLPQTL